MIEFPLTFDEINFVNVPKIHEIRKICSPRKKATFGSKYIYQNCHIQVLLHTRIDM